LLAYQRWGRYELMLCEALMHLMLCSCCAKRMLTDNTVLCPATVVLMNYEQTANEFW
jgi:hypothetical protein